MLIGFRQTSRQNAKKEVRFPSIYRYVPRVLENVDTLLRFPICAVLALIVLSAIGAAVGPRTRW